MIEKENVIPGNHGKVFATKAGSEKQMNKIIKLVLEVPGIKDVILNGSVFPKEFTVHTESLVRISDIQMALKNLHLHAIPKSLFKL